MSEVEGASMERPETSKSQEYDTPFALNRYRLWFNLVEAFWPKIPFNNPRMLYHNHSHFQHLSTPPRLTVVRHAAGYVMETYRRMKHWKRVVVTNRLNVYLPRLSLPLLIHT